MRGGVLYTSVVVVPVRESEGGEREREEGERVRERERRGGREGKRGGERGSEGERESSRLWFPVRMSLCLCVTLNTSIHRPYLIRDDICQVVCVCMCMCMCVSAPACLCVCLSVYARVRACVYVLMCNKTVMTSENCDVHPSRTL